jgi:hypothetical protein
MQPFARYLFTYGRNWDTMFVQQQPRRTNMSNIQDAIEREISEQIETRIDDAIYENSDVQQLKSDVEELSNSLDIEELVNKVMLQLTHKLVKDLDDGYVMIKRSYLNQLEEKDNN